MPVTIRTERPEDSAVVRAINLAAFEGSTEADLVDALRVSASPLISLVAEIEGKIVGHVLFSPMTIDGDHKLLLMGLAPMAVAPAHQRKGAGSALIRAGLERCKQLGADAVFVLGHPNYYPRFGFQPSARFGVRSDYDVPEGTFLAIELRPGSLHGVNGIVHYHEAFREE